MTIGARGKAAETKVRDYLKTVQATDINFDFERIQDARAAGGAFAAQVGDFYAFREYKGVHRSFILEVKEVDHEYRLPAKNFKKEQIARMRKRMWAGQRPIVLVYFSPKKLWREVPLTYFIDHLDAPSWDLREFELKPLPEALAPKLEIQC